MGKYWFLKFKGKNLRKKFSEKYGHKVRDALQVESMDDGLKNRLWNQFLEFYIHSIDIGGSHIQFIYAIKDNKDKDFFRKLYDSFFKTSIHPSVVNIYEIQREIEKFYLKMKWFEIYDFIEYISVIYHKKQINLQFREVVNQVLEDEMSGYRFVGDYITPIIDKVEIQSVKETLECEYRVPLHKGTKCDIVLN